MYMIIKNYLFGNKGEGVNSPGQIFKANFVIFVIIMLRISKEIRGISNEIAAPRFIGDFMTKIQDQGWSMWKKFKSKPDFYYSVQ